MAGLSARAWRALALVCVTVVGVLVIGAAHLGRWPPAPAAAPGPTSGRAPTVDDAGHVLIANDQWLWTSTDDGRTWEQRPLGMPHDRHAIAVVLAAGRSLIVATAGPNLGTPPDLTLLRSDAGDSWRELRLPRRPGS
jgi:hypothetical protein